ncbi:MAG: carbonic anhydrase [Alteromonadaceae bacterium]|jgi:carbonic anhydrase
MSSYLHCRRHNMSSKSVILFFRRYFVPYITFDFGEIMNLTTIRLALVLLSTLSINAVAGDVHWDYKGKHGAEHWGSLASKFSTCQSGVNQSPINITGVIEASLPPLNINYQASNIDIVNNGHTIQANIAAGNTFSNDSGNFDLKQFHFHAPSENTIDGKSFPMEVHFVHVDSQGRLAVIGVMFEQGEENKTLAKLWSKMPKSAGEKNKLSELLNGKNLMPVSSAYFRFNGSLTTPPCSEGVRWFVLKDPISASKTQIEHFSKTMGRDTNRPVQNINARIIIK